MALVLLATAKTLADITDSGRDTMLAALLPKVQQAIFDACNREMAIAATAETVYFDGEGNASLFPDRYPITAVTTLHDDTNAPPTYGTGSLISSNDYVVYDNKIVLRGFRFADGLKNVKLVYNGGYIAEGVEGANTPDGLVLAIALALRWYAERVGSIATSSEAIADQNLNRQFITEMPDAIKDLLGPFWRPTI